MAANDLPAVVRDPNVMLGAPLFRGTRIPVRAFWEHLDAGGSPQSFVDRFPSLTLALVLAAAREFGTDLTVEPVPCHLELRNGWSVVVFDAPTPQMTHENVMHMVDDDRAERMLTVAGVDWLDPRTWRY